MLAVFLTLSVWTGVGFTSMAEETDASVDFDVNLSVYVNGTQLSDSSEIYRGSTFSYGIQMDAKDVNQHFSDGDVINYHVGNVKGLNYDAIRNMDQYIDDNGEHVKVGVATFSYNSSTGSIDVSMAFNESVERYDHLKMHFASSQRGSFDNINTGEQLLIEINGQQNVTKTVTEYPGYDDGDVFTNDFREGSVLEADKNAAFGTSNPDAGTGGYSVGNNTYAGAVWDVWYGKSINDYESSGAPGTYHMGGNLIFTDTLDTNQKFGTDDNALTMNIGYDLENGAPFSIQLPVHYFGTIYSENQSSDANSFVWHPYGDTKYGYYGYGTDSNGRGHMYETVTGSAFENVNATENLKINDRSKSDEIINAVESSAGMSFGIYTNLEGKQTLIINFGKLGTGSNTLKYSNDFLEKISNRVNDQKLATSGDTSVFDNTLAYYNNNNSVFGFNIRCFSYIDNTAATEISNKGSFNLVEGESTATNQNTYHASISGQVRNGDFVLKKTDSGELSGPVSDREAFSALNGLSGAEFQIVDKSSGNVLKFSMTDNEYIYSEGIQNDEVDNENVFDTVSVDEEGVALIRGLANGKTFLLKETKAPDNYIKGDDIDFTVSGATVNYFAMKNVLKDRQDNQTPIDGSGNNNDNDNNNSNIPNDNIQATQNNKTAETNTPITGDTSAILLWGVLIISSLIAILILKVMKKTSH